MTWIKAASLAELRENPVVIKRSPKQIAVFSAAGGDAVYAVDNRCPHEGYPLAAGMVSNGCVLTCNWHNWKFRLDTGECLIGGDHVRSYPTKVENGDAWVDIADPPLEETRLRILAGLKAAFDERDFGRICREIARLHYCGLDAADSVAAALEWAHDRLEFGARHGIAGAADWLRLAGNYGSDFESRLICWSEAVDHLADDSLRHPQYRYPGPGTERFATAAFLASVEEEDAGRAEAMVAGGLSGGLHWQDMEEAFAAAAFAHYNDFGHSPIYVHKTAQLVKMLGPEVERAVMLPLARHLCYTTREDLLPEFKDYAPAVAGLPGRLSQRPAGETLAVPFPAGLAAALEWLRTSLESCPPEQVYDAMLEGLALNLLCCDTRHEAAYDGPVNENIGWLDFTHAITMSNAARNLCFRYPRFWKPALAQMACFLGRNHDFIDRTLDRRPWYVEDETEFFRGVHLQLLDHGFQDPIFSVHLLKTAMAVADELPTASASCRRALLAGLNRFLKSPIKTKHVRRLARQAIRLVGRDFEG